MWTPKPNHRHKQRLSTTPHHFPDHVLAPCNTSLQTNLQELLAMWLRTTWGESKQNETSLPPKDAGHIYIYIKLPSQKKGLIGASTWMDQLNWKPWFYMILPWLLGLIMGNPTNQPQKIGELIVTGKSTSFHPLSCCHNNLRQPLRKPARFFRSTWRLSLWRPDLVRWCNSTHLNMGGISRGQQALWGILSFFLSTKSKSRWDMNDMNHAKEQTHGCVWK